MSSSGNSKVEKFNLFYNENKDKFLSIALSYVHDRGAAEDIVSECFMNYLVKSKENLEIRTVPEAYLLKSVRNRCLNYLRDQQNRMKVVVPVDEVTFRSLQNEIRAFEGEDLSFLFKEDVLIRMKEILAELPEETRRIFLMSRDEGLTYKEIAQRLSISERMVKRHITKALDLFKLRMGACSASMIAVFFTFFSN